MQDRHYQKKQVDEVIQALSAKRKVVLQLPTGGGKTVEFCMILDRYLHSTVRNFLEENRSSSVLILVHREELMYQAQKTIKRMLNINPILITSQTTHYKVARVYIGMVESLVRRLDCFSGVGLVIVDEAHINSFNKVHNIFLEELIIGVTATPISAVKKEPVNKYYYDIVCGPQIGELIENKYLSKNFTRCPKDIVDASKFSISSLDGDYNTLQMANEYKLPKYVRNVVTQYEQWCEGQKTIVFNVNIEHSNEVAKCLSFCGYPARHLGSDNEHERHEILQWFHDTEDAILCNVGMTTVGFDEPTVRKIILNYSTLSLAKYLQTCGRGSRFIDEQWLLDHQSSYPYTVKLKNTFDIIDLGGNWAKFGDWSDDRDWKFIFNNPEAVKNGLAPVKTCPKCDGLLHAAVKICTLMDWEGNMCLYEFESKRPKETAIITDMVLVNGSPKEMEMQKLIEKNKKKHDYYTMEELADPYVKTIKQRIGHSPKQEEINRYFRNYYNDCITWWNTFKAGKEDCIEDITQSGFHIRKAQNNFNELLRKNYIQGKHTKIYDWNVTEESEFIKEESWTEDFQKLFEL